MPVSTAQGYPTLLTNVKCLGNESSILDCFHDVIGSGHCGVGLASVYCMSGTVFTCMPSVYVQVGRGTYLPLTLSGQI